MSEHETIEQEFEAEQQRLEYLLLPGTPEERSKWRDAAQLLRELRPDQRAAIETIVSFLMRSPTKACVDGVKTPVEDIRVEQGKLIGMDLVLYELEPAQLKKTRDWLNQNIEKEPE